jgi:ribosomal protein S6--L-glutamate ligase
MVIAVLTSPNSWYWHDLQRAAGAEHVLRRVDFCRLETVLRSGQTHRISAAGTVLTELDAVLVRTMPPGSLEQVVFRMNALAQLERSGTRVLNPPRSLEIAVDKYLTLARLEAHGLPVPATATAQTWQDALLAFELLGGDVVLKPIFGGEGRGITRINDVALAERAFRMLEQLGAVIYQQQFVPHEGCDLRLLVIGDQVVGMRRCNANDWRTNVSRGAVTEPLPLDASLTELARRAATAVQCPLAGVDVLPGKDGRLYVLEVNAVPGWKALARTLRLDVARLVLELATRPGDGSR